MQYRGLCSVIAAAGWLAVVWSVHPGAMLAAEQIPPAAAKEAQEIYNTRCVTCHGPTGKGDGPVGAALSPKPRDLSDPAWQKSVTDEYIEKIIINGGGAVGKSPLMPSNPDLTAKPDVVKALRALVRGFAPHQ